MITAALLSLGLAAKGEGTEFATVSIARSHSSSLGYSGHVESKPGQPVRLTLQNVSLAFCIQHAYAVKEYQVTGPGWMKKARYDITATLPPGSALSQVWLALQALLAERLKLSIRREQKDMSIYTLAVAKNGPKLHPASDATSGAFKFQGGGRDVTDVAGSGTLRLDNASISEFCGMLSGRAKRPVLDATGISGNFDFELHYRRPRDMYGLSISDALEKQLGLRLEPQKGPVETIVVESAIRTPVKP